MHIGTFGFRQPLVCGGSVGCRPIGGDVLAAV